MSAATLKLTLAQARILWWMNTTGERPLWISERPSWQGGHHSTLCPHGLGRPYLPLSTVESLLDSGLLHRDPQTMGPEIIAFPRKDWPESQKYLHAWRRNRGQPTVLIAQRELFLTEPGRRAAPTEVPYPWRPNLNGMSDITRCEHERLLKVAAYLACVRTRPHFFANPVTANPNDLVPEKLTGPDYANVIRLVRKK